MLLADVRAPRGFTVDHAVTLLVLIGTVATGHNHFWGKPYNLASGRRYKTVGGGSF